MKRLTCALAGAAALAGTPQGHTAAAAPSPFAPLSFLVGHCWKGTFPDGKATDEHCFTWVYGGKFVRDQHVVRHGAGRPEDLGESIYLWDASKQELQYLYIESAGGFSRGTVCAQGETLIFPPTRYSENGVEQTYRSRWQRSGEHAYDVVSEFLVKGAWMPGFKVHMEQTQPAASG